MRIYQKVIIFLTVGLLLSLFIDFRMPDYSVKSIGMDTAFAENGDKENAEQNSTEKSSEGETADGSEENPCPECPECPDPAKVVLRGLEEKKTMVDKAMKTMQEEKRQLETFEEQIDEKLEKLAALKKQIQEDMALLEKKKTAREQEEEAAYEAQIRRLVKTYETMKPKAAAPIINEMNLEVAQEIFLRMKEAAASQILSYVDSGKAAKISERLAFKEK